MFRYILMACMLFWSTQCLCAEEQPRPALINTSGIVKSVTADQKARTPIPVAPTHGVSDNRQSDLSIETVPTLHVELSSKTNLYLLLIPFVTIVIVIGSTIITLKTIKTNADGVRQNFLDTIKSQKEISEREIRTKVLSQNRQKWIDELRNELSEFCSALFYLANHADIADDEPVKVEFARFIANVELRYAKIQLLINPKEGDHKELIALMKEAILTFSNKENDRRADLRVALNKVIDKSQEILKREWERVKRLD